MTTPLTAWPGTISIGANGTAITGANASLQTANKGALIIVEGLVGQLSEDPTDDNTATLLEPISASAITNAPYVLVPISGAVVQAQRVRQLIETLAVTKPGIPLTMDATTTLGDPGAGKVRFNDPTNPTVACISYTDNLGNSCKARVQALDDSVNAVARAVLEFLPTDDANAYLDLDVTGAITDGTTYAQVPVALRSGTVPADGAALAMVGVAAGADGANGISGFTPNSLPSNDYHQATAPGPYQGSGSSTVNPPPGSGEYGTLLSLARSTTIVSQMNIFAESTVYPEVAFSGTGDSGSTWSAWWVVPLLPSFLTAPTPPQGRLSLSSGVAVSEADVTGATTIYYVPSIGGLVPVCDGTKYVLQPIGTQLSLALDATSTDTGYHQSGKNFDLFAFMNAGVLTLGTGPAWTSDTARSATLKTVGGLLVNNSSITLRFGSATGNTVSVSSGNATYLGSFRATANGQATDSKAKRLLFNAYNAVPRALAVYETTAQWGYATGAWRQANGSTANQVEVLIGLAGTSVDLAMQGLAGDTVDTSVSVHMAIGLDSTTAYAADSMPAVAKTTTTSYAVLNSKYSGCPGLGHHVLAWLEFGGGTSTNLQIFGSDGSTYQFGLNGKVTM
jgi:hypothetical protein